MSLVLNLKKKLALLLSVILLSTIFAFTGAPIKAEAATDNVSFYYLDSQYYYRYGTIKNIYIKVKNISYEKNVTVHYKNFNSDQWLDQSAEYVKSLGDGYEIWKASISNYGTNVESFCIKYEVNGNTYWDNNDGKNYNYTDTLGVAPLHVARGYYDSENNLKVNLKNYGYEKSVKVVYTYDNWATEESKDLVYKETTTNGEEVWAASIEKTDSIQYYIKYTVNGQTYYDSNFGSNYDSSYGLF
ncbi:CBM21 domain-containing protein [Clostridium bornimense]|uniref:CBM21 domain-containing protein n=1 Tax=Clostridium bornimense TaxID=1216932 RepID=UPI001C0FD5C6|nr:CBM21 domain-containing protein [Clostridium bornimense]MBU5317560.1 CBM21 domain-containing protein [Clostridium bornimense]